MHPLKLALLISFFILNRLFVLSTSAQEASTTLEAQLPAYLGAIHEKKGFSGEILIAKNGHLLFHKAIGLASVEDKLPLQKGEVYRIASISKTFTATLIAMAVAENKLAYTDQLGKYLPEISGKLKEVTLQQLLSHSGGVPHYDAIENYWPVLSRMQLTDGQIIKKINGLELLFEPGTQMHYSSLGYFLLAKVLENVYTDNFQHLLHSKILQQLRLGNTGTDRTGTIISNMARGYHWVTDDSLIVAPYRNYSMLKGSGSMYATANDLLQWSNNFLDNQLLTPAQQQALFTPNLYAGNTTAPQYGLGWYIDTGAPKKYYHGGGTWGYSSYLAIYPESRISIIVLSNVSTLPINSIANDLEDIVFGRSHTIAAPEKEVKLAADQLNLYTGTYKSPTANMQLNIRLHEHRLYAQLSGNPPFEIYPKNNHQFFGKKVDVTLSFSVDNGVVSGLTADRKGQTVYFKKAAQ